MPDKPAAEIDIDSEVIRRLLRDQASHVVDAASVPLELTAAGWDSEVWRVGAAWAARLPRRAAAAPLMEKEQRWLPELAARLDAVGVGIPLARVAGRPGHGYPWHWSLVPWFEGRRGLDVPRSERGSWARPLAAVLAALHAPAGEGYPVNPWRGVPLAARDDSVRERLASLSRRTDADPAVIAVLSTAWGEGVSARPWSGPAVWIHGDLHPGNLVGDASGLTAVIDWGDLTAGDPAYDLAIAWLAFDGDARAVFRQALPRYDAATWVRARGWAAAVAVLLLEHSDDNPDYAALGHDAAHELTRG